MPAVCISKLQVCVYKTKVNLLYLPPSHLMKQRQSLTTFLSFQVLSHRNKNFKKLLWVLFWRAEIYIIGNVSIQELDVLKNFH